MFKRLFLLLMLLPALSFADSFVAGKDYDVLTSAPEANTEKGTPVLEFFSYGCPGCYRLEPLLNKWTKQHQAQINFKRVPVVFNKEWIYYAKAYYAANLLNKSALLDPVLFKAIQTEKKTLTSNQAMIDFFVAAGINKDLANSAFNNSTTVDMNVNEGNVLMGRMRINAVPAIVVNNQFKTDLKMAQNEDRLFKILDFLLQKSQKK